jgi:hypothetical protein
MKLEKDWSDCQAASYNFTTDDWSIAYLDQKGHIDESRVTNGIKKEDFDQ